MDIMVYQETGVKRKLVVDLGTGEPGSRPGRHLLGDRHERC